MTSEIDKEQFNSDVAHHVAGLLRIPTARNDSLANILNKIKVEDPKANQATISFLKAWNNWFECTNQNADLTLEQQKEVSKLAIARNKARKTLLELAKNLRLKKVTIYAKSNAEQPGAELSLLSKIRRDLYAHGPIEIDPDAKDFSTRRDQDGKAYFQFVTEFWDLAKQILDRFQYSSKVDVKLQQVEGEQCLNCGTTHKPVAPPICDNCGFREITACANCHHEISRSEYIRVSGNLYRCPNCAARVRLTFADPLTMPNGNPSEPSIFVEEAD